MTTLATRWQRTTPAAALFIALGACAVGALAMFMFDSVSGRRRRAIIRDKALSAGRVLSETIDKRGRDVRQRLQGAAIETGKRVRGESVPDERLVERVRSAMGRYVRATRAIEVTAHDGVVCLRGPVLATEAAALLAAARKVPGVRDVDNQLDVRARADIPAMASS